MTVLSKSLVGVVPFLGLLIAVTAVSCGESEDAGDKTGSTGSELGRRTFDRTCGDAGCHGTDGVSGPGANFPDVIPTKTDSEIETIIKNGAGSMPAQSLNDDEIAAVIEYLRERFPQGGQPTGDPSEGGW